MPVILGRNVIGVSGITARQFVIFTKYETLKLEPCPATEFTVDNKPKCSYVSYFIQLFCFSLQGNYTLPRARFQLQTTRLARILSGRYRARVVITKSDDILACYRAFFTVRSSQ